MNKEKKVSNEYGIIDPQPEKCNHRIASRATSIVLLPGSRTFTFPEHVFGVCKYCGKPFHYLRDIDGKLVAYNNDATLNNNNNNNNNNEKEGYVNADN